MVWPWYRTTEPSRPKNKVRMIPNQLILPHTRRTSVAWNKTSRSTGIQCSSISIKSTRILTGILRLFAIQLDHLQVAFSLYSLLLAKSTMRFIQFVITCATLTLFNIYAYAKPVPSLDSVGHLEDWCAGYDSDSCHNHCTHEGFTHSNCTTEYVQMPLYKFELTLTCKLQFMCLRVSCPPF